MIRKWLHEPFVHFILIGALLFCLYELTAVTTDPTLDTVIQINSADINQLSEQWLNQNGSKPDKSTLNELIESKIYQEVMLREAKRLGLDRNDTIVRRRLVQKMEFLSANLSQLQLPDNEILLAYFEKNEEQYRVVEKRSFTHVYFSKDKRGQSLLDDAQAVLDKLLQQDSDVRAATLGDNFILQYDYKNRSQRQLAQVFGDKFSHALFGLDAEQWQGPVLSEYGAHLVLIHQISASYIPGFMDIRSRVLNDFMQEKLVNLKEKSFSDMRARYQIHVDELQNESS